MIAPKAEDSKVSIDALPSSIDADFYFFHQVDFLLRFKDKGIRNAYNNFVDTNQTLSSQFTLSLVLLCLTVPMAVLMATSFTRSTSSFEKCIWIITILIVFGINMFNWKVFFSKQRELKNSPNGELPLASKQYIKNVHMIVFFILNFLTCFRLISRVVNGQCEKLSLRDSWNCNPLASNSFLPPETLLITCFLPIMYSLIGKGANFEFSLVLWVMTMASMLFSMIFAEANGVILFAIIYSVVSLLSIVELKRQHYVLFLTNQKLQDILAEREKAADEANATEMRHLIGNLAHDLKTVRFTI
jgi:hypothetical protein